MWPDLGQTGPGPFVVSPMASTSYTVLVMSACGTLVSDDVLVEVQSPPLISLPEVIAEGCETLHVEFPAGRAAQSLNYLWDLGDGTTSAEAAPIHDYPAGQYTVTLQISTPIGCTATALNSGSVIVHDLPEAAFSASTTLTDIDSPGIQFINASSGNVVANAWTFGDGGTSDEGSPFHAFTDTGSFSVELIVATAFGCTDTATIAVRIDPTHHIELPNTFTPDPGSPGGGAWSLGNYTNDVFFAFARYVDEFEMTIWNRWGELVFESRDIRIGWDGWYKGELSPQDVYAYRVQASFSDGHREVILGNVTLLR
jgi:gliding motility-associated-like protein